MQKIYEPREDKFLDGLMWQYEGIVVLWLSSQTTWKCVDPSEWQVEQVEKGEAGWREGEKVR